MKKKDLQNLSFGILENLLSHACVHVNGSPENVQNFQAYQIIPSCNIENTVIFKTWLSE